MCDDGDGFVVACLDALVNLLKRRGSTQLDVSGVEAVLRGALTQDSLPVVERCVTGLGEVKRRLGSLTEESQCEVLGVVTRGRFACVRERCLELLSGTRHNSIFASLRLLQLSESAIDDQAYLTECMQLGQMANLVPDNYDRLYRILTTRADLEGGTLTLLASLDGITSSTVPAVLVDHVQRLATSSSATASNTACAARALLHKLGVEVSDVRAGDSGRSWIAGCPSRAHFHVVRPLSRVFRDADTDTASSGHGTTSTTPK